MSDTAPTIPADDPVRARRAVVARWTALAKRVGYLCFVVALAVFFIGIATSFNRGVALTIVVTMGVGSALLAPALVLGYAVKAAERDDRERGL